MSSEPLESTAALPPHAQLIQMASGYWISKIVYAAAKLGLADHLTAGPKSAVDLAGPTGTQAAALHRLMRSLAGLGLLTQVDEQRFTVTPLGTALQAGAPGAARSSVLTLAGPSFVAAFEQIMHSLETGDTGFEKAMGMPIFDYLSQHLDEAVMFGETMVGVHGAEPPAVAEAYDFSGFGQIVDVGGSTGNLLSTILARHPAPGGGLSEIPHGVAGARVFQKARGREPRVPKGPGIFLKTVPAGADAYLLSHVIHDWNEEQCLTILGNCRQAMKPSSRL